MSYGFVELNVGKDGDKIAVDEIASNHYQQVKIGHGTEGNYTDASQAFPFPTSDFYTLVSQGLVTNHALLNKFGRNSALPNGSFAFISGLGPTGWPLSAATTVRIKAGGNAADDAAGAGAREITIQGIDDSFNEITVAITTAGASASAATTELFWRVHRAWPSGVGTYGGANTGAITIENSGGGTDIITLAAGEGRTQFAGWSTPAGVTAYMLSAEPTVDSSKSADFAIYTREDFDDTVAPMPSKQLRKYYDGVTGSSTPGMWKTPRIILPPKSDIWVEGQGNGVGVEASFDFELLLVTA